MRHIPVLANEVIDGLHLKSGMNVIDCTLGDAGHSEKILEKIGPNGRLLGIDADAEAILRSKQYLYNFGDRVTCVCGNFVNIAEVARANGFANAQGILADLGWSTPQFEERGRGFSFAHPDEVLDMRYGAKAADEYETATAAELLREFPEDEIETILRVYGEERFSKEIAHEIATVRIEKEIKTVGDLVEIVLVVYRRKLKSTKEIPWVGGTHPATQVFQALRIAVNKELSVLEEALPQMVDLLAPGGRLAIITFHSLEDRIVKHFFKDLQNKIINIITKKPIIATEEELKNNPRARSAKLRIIEKL